MSEIIRLSKVEYTYPGAEEKALYEIDFSAMQGESIAIVGRNGSGKSTLAKLLNALYPISSGSLTVDGRQVDSQEGVMHARRTIGMVFQNPDNQLVASVVEEDVAFGPENIGIDPKEIRQRVDAALAAVGMTEKSKHSVYTLSGGQKQRVAIAGALAMRPRVLVLDESTAMLDPSGRQEVLHAVKKLNRQEGITVIWITHFMDEAIQFDRICAMHEGRMVFDGSPMSFFDDAALVEKLGLEMPKMCQLSQTLRREGYDVPAVVRSVQEMAEAICPLFLKM